jgi:hypothetical protein
MRTRSRHLPNLIRLTAFLSAGLVVTSVASMRSARAHMNEGMRRLARQLMPYAEQGVIEAPRRVVINNESLYLAMGTTHDSVPAVLDYYERQCARRAGRLTESLANEARQTQRLDQAAFNALWHTPGRRSVNFETVREGDSEGGYVACIDVGDRKLDAAELARRLQAVVRTGDLHEYGNLRYAYVTRSSGGSRVLTVATDGSFNFGRMFPATGDAPGDDPPEVVRFPGMRRVLSAHEEGHPNALGMYTVTAPLAQVRDHYRREMPRRGWTIIDLPRDRQFSPELEARRDKMVALTRGDSATLLLVFDQSGATTSVMTLLGQ